MIDMILVFHSIQCEKISWELNVFRRDIKQNTKEEEKFISDISSDY